MRIPQAIFCLMLSVAAKASNAGNIASESILAPAEQTQTAVKKEIITITIGRDSTAIVDLYYEQSNKPVYKRYTYQMRYNAPNEVSALSDQSAKTDQSAPHWLIPATHWANHQAADFTLRIINKQCISLYLPSQLFEGADFQITGRGFGRIWNVTTPRSEDVIIADVWDEKSPMEWRKMNFRPNHDLIIANADALARPSFTRSHEGYVVADADGIRGRYVGECGDSLLISCQELALISKKEGTIVLHKAENAQGHLSISTHHEQPYRKVKVHETMSKNSKVLCVIEDEEGYMPEEYPCLGYQCVKETPDGSHTAWYKIKVNDKIGYVEEQEMEWDSL